MAAGCVIERRPVRVNHGWCERKVKEVAPAICRLIEAAINCVAGEVAIEKGSNCSMGDDGNCSCGSVSLHQARNSAYHSRLSIDCSFPASYRDARLEKEFVGNGFELISFQEARGRTIVFSQLSYLLELKRSALSKDLCSVNCLLFSARVDGSNTPHPRLAQSSLHSGSTQRR